MTRIFIETMPDGKKRYWERQALIEAAVRNVIKEWLPFNHNNLHDFYRCIKRNGACVNYVRQEFRNIIRANPLPRDVCE